MADEGTIVEGGLCHRSQSEASLLYNLYGEGVM